MACCMRVGSSGLEKPGPVKKRFDFVFQRGGKTIGFSPTGPPHHITDPITNQFKGIAYTYLCTKDGSMYSTNKLEAFE